ncbi:MAG: chemotaxis protein CheW [Acidobacteriota bacterium]
MSDDKRSRPGRRKSTKPRGTSRRAGKATEPSQTSSDSESTDPQSTAQDVTSSAGNEPPRKRELPAFGFAADLLGDTASSESKASSEDGAPANDETAPTIDTAGIDTGRIDAEKLGELAAVDGQDRIFDFADRLTAHGARHTDEEVAPRRIEPWITCALANEIYALPVAPVREVLRVTGITRVPHAPRPIRGVTHVRGRVIPVIDLRRRLELDPAPLERASRIVVVAARQRLIGLLVDVVYQVVQIDLDRVETPPDDVMTVQSDYLQGVYALDEQLILLLDVERVLIIHEASGAA